MTVAAPQALDDERAVLGAVFLSDTVLPALLIDAGLRPEHFSRDTHGEVFRAMTRLHDRGEPADIATVRAELKRTQATRETEVDLVDLDLLTGTVPAVGNVIAYANTVREHAILRQKLRAAYAIQAGVHAHDFDAIAEAEGQLQVDAAENRTRTPEQLGAALVDFLEKGGGERWSTPWMNVTRALVGGVRRGTVTVVVGHSSHGKSAATDDLVDTIVSRYRVRAHVYINEMTAEERTLRYAARETGIALSRLMEPDKAKLTADD